MFQESIQYTTIIILLLISCYEQNSYFWSSSHAYSDGYTSYKCEMLSNR
jgi:hypothetical protein